MAIERVEIKDFFVFNGELAIDFCNGVNVLIGGNGTGKTTLLRGLYGNVGYHYHELRQGYTIYTNSIFSHLAPAKPVFNIYEDGRLVHELPIIENSAFFDEISKLSKNIIYISESNILSHAQGLLETTKYGGLKYEFREIAVIERARVLPSKPKPALVERIEKIIGGTVELSDDGQSFLIAKPFGKIDLLFEASGYQKLALLARLIHNGMITDGTTILWDEPENSLNPELVPVLVDILLELVREHGVQIFLATHDYNLARYFDVREDRNIPVMFHNFSKSEDGQIKCESVADYMKLSNNLLEKADEDLFKAVVSTAIKAKK
jgi:ABC-type cobalamin/Fe3+-siderophores transport system ATPase subunit